MVSSLIETLPLTRAESDGDLDFYFLDRALALAAKGEGQVKPNPLVGTVIVNDGVIVGQGFHRYDRVKHAEVLALEQAGRLAKGATVYVNLEPCCHRGDGKRTPPCTDALIEAGVKRVVCCITDPNPRVNWARCGRSSCSRYRRDSWPKNFCRTTTKCRILKISHHREHFSSLIVNATAF